ncbi:MAG TPA: hypothetical protein VK361_04665 [Rubrobacteraceae bacterium]|nr:hypothetical protein [Rubrobacteraceae bacterium]
MHPLEHVDVLACFVDGADRRLDLGTLTAANSGSSTCTCLQPASCVVVLPTLVNSSPRQRWIRRAVRGGPLTRRPPGWYVRPL